MVVGRRYVAGLFVPLAMIVVRHDTDPVQVSVQYGHVVTLGGRKSHG